MVHQMVILNDYQVPWNVPNRAYLTFSRKLLELQPSIIPEASLGVFAKTFITHYTVIREYEEVHVAASRKGTAFTFMVGILVM